MSTTIYVRGTEIRALILYIVYLIWKYFGTDVHINLFSTCELRANFPSKSLILLHGGKEFLPALNSPVSDLCKIRSKRSTHITVDHFRFS